MFIYWISILLLALCLFLRKNSEVSHVQSPVNNRIYLVQNLPDKKMAADALANLHLKLDELVSLLVHADTGTDNHAAINRLTRRFKGKISERTTESVYTSYTVDKGEEIHMCLRQPDNTMVDPNTVFFVALHEMAHIMTVSQGHTAEFRKNFKYLLKRAMDFRLYQYEPYHVNAVDYCGIKIKNTPMK